MYILQGKTQNDQIQQWLAGRVSQRWKMAILHATST